MRIPTRQATLSLAVALALTLLLAGLAIAAAIKQKGGAVGAVYTATANDIVTTSSTTYVDVPGMQVVVHVPANQKAILLITFSAQANCEDDGQVAKCFVTGDVDGFAVSPPDTVFESDVDGNGRSDSMQFVSVPVSAGDHTVKVRFSPNRPTTTFTLGSRTLTVLRSKV